MHKNFTTRGVAMPGPRICRPGWPDPGDLDDSELHALIDALTRGFLETLDPVEADLLARADLQGQPLARIAAETGLPLAEIAPRLRATRQSLCRYVVLTLTPSKSAC
ncbi:MAG: hypothetical protein C0524_12915 [Rhodobacter sp.]|nr:hypothetical protein [Rhodobacter sp.]